MKRTITAVSIAAAIASSMPIATAHAEQLKCYTTSNYGGKQTQTKCYGMDGSVVETECWTLTSYPGPFPALPQCTVTTKP